METHGNITHFPNITPGHQIQNRSVYSHTQFLCHYSKYNDTYILCSPALTLLYHHRCVCIPRVLIYSFGLFISSIRVHFRSAGIHKNKGLCLDRARMFKVVFYVGSTKALRRAASCQILIRVPCNGGRAQSATDSHTIQTHQPITFR